MPGTFTTNVHASGLNKKLKLGSDPNCFEMTVWRRQAAKITRRGENSRWLPPVFVEDGLRRAMGTEGR